MNIQIMASNRIDCVHFLTLVYPKKNSLNHHIPLAALFAIYMVSQTVKRKKPHSAYRQIIEITGSIWHIFPLESSTIKNEYFVLIPWCFIIGRTGCHTEKSFQLCSHWKTTFFCVSFSSKRLWHLKGMRNGIVKTQGRIRYGSTQCFIQRYEGSL